MQQQIIQNVYGQAETKSEISEKTYKKSLYVGVQTTGKILSRYNFTLDTAKLSHVSEQSNWGGKKAK